MNLDYKTLEYPLEFLVDKAAKGSKWAQRELRLNGYGDYAEADAGNPPKGV